MSIRHAPEQWNHLGTDRLPGLLGFEVTGVGEGEVRAALTVHDRLLAHNGYLHAGTVVTMADTCCGIGCFSHLPDGASNFTTIELKSNHLATATDGHLDCVARVAHQGRTTQVWDAVVTHRETGRTLALFRCTQMVLYPRAGAPGTRPEGAAALPR